MSELGVGLNSATGWVGKIRAFYAHGGYELLDSDWIRFRYQRHAQKLRQDRRRGYIRKTVAALAVDLGIMHLRHGDHFLSNGLLRCVSCASSQNDLDHPDDPSLSGPVTC